MTGRDPAVEAAIKAWRTASHGRHGDLPSSETVTAMLTDAAREMAKPIRAWFQQKYAEALAEDLYDNRDLLDELAPLIYSDDELKDNQ